MQILSQPSGPERLGDWLKANLRRDWTMFRAAVAFVKRSGVRHIADALGEFARSNSVEIIAGIDHGGTSYEGLRALLEATFSGGRVIVFHNPLPHTFHPKVYLFKSATSAEMVVGSGNLTSGGLFTNYEASLLLSLDLACESDREVLGSIEASLDEWADESSGTSLLLDDSRLEALVEAGLVPNEADRATSAAVVASSADEHSGPDDAASLFRAVGVTPAPAIGPSIVAHPEIARAAFQGAGRRFVMTLQKTDVGIGQTTAGTSRRSPEVFVPLTARDAEPEFWKWRDGFEEDPDRPGKFDRRGVRMRIGNAIVAVNMMTWPIKHDFRLRSEVLRSIGNIGDILVMESVEGEDFGYDVSVVAAGSPEYEDMLAKCNQSVRNSVRRFGYF